MLIPKTRLIRSEIETSRLGFGCSRLHYLPDAKARQTILNTAFELGYLHFDVAPSYGHGINERALGEFIRTHRASCTIATKFGLRVSPIVDLASAISPRVGRTVLGLTSLVRRVAPVDANIKNPTPQLLEQSISRSLRRLRIDHIDIHFIHEPARGSGSLSLVRALLPTYRRMQKSGIIGRIGLSGDFETCRSLWAQLNEPDILLQVPETEWTDDCPPDFTFKAIDFGAQGYLAQERHTPDEIASRIRRALGRRSQGVVLVSTTSLDHLKSLASAAASAENKS